MQVRWREKRLGVILNTVIKKGLTEQIAFEHRFREVREHIRLMRKIGK